MGEEEEGLSSFSQGEEEEEEEEGGWVGGWVGGGTYLLFLNQDLTEAAGAEGGVRVQPQDAGLVGERGLGC